MVAATLAIAVPMLGSLQAFTAVTSIATIGAHRPQHSGARCTPPERRVDNKGQRERGSANSTRLTLPLRNQSTPQPPGSYLSYGAPIALHLCTKLFRCSTFKPGPWHLGVWSVPICAAATFWVLFLTALFVLPTVLPVTPQTLNYAGALAGGVLVVALVVWGLSARKWFDGPNTARVLAERRLGAHVGQAAGGSGGSSSGSAAFKAAAQGP